MRTIDKEWLSTATVKPVLPGDSYLEPSDRTDRFIVILWSRTFTDTALGGAALVSLLGATHHTRHVFCLITSRVAPQYSRIVDLLPAAHATAYRPDPRRHPLTSPAMAFADHVYSTFRVSPAFLAARVQLGNGLKPPALPV